jgi:hypothetical protein
VEKIDPTCTRSAASLFAAGWRGTEPMPRVSPPLGLQTASANYVADWTWQAMVLMELASDPAKLRE